jgi:photosynthetic reaction center H subunit
MTLARVDTWRRHVKVKSLLGAQFADAPGLSNPDQVTLAEEDRITAYFAGGTLYAEPSRLGPWL